MKRPLVSYCVPAYNVQHVLPACIHSIFTEGMNDFEVILVNDASTDGTLEMARQLARDDRRLRLVEHPYNMGLPSARNTALLHAEGDFIRHIDSDDMVTAGSTSSLLHAIENADVARGSSRLFHVDGGDTYPMAWANTGIGDFQVEDVLRSDFFRCNALGYVWLYLYRAEFLERLGNPQFEEGLNILEDDIYNAEVLPQAGRVSVTDTVVTLYRSGGMSSGKTWGFRQYLEQANALAVVAGKLGNEAGYLSHYLNRKAAFVIEKTKAIGTAGLSFPEVCAYAEVIRSVYASQDISLYRERAGTPPTGFRSYPDADVQLMERIASGDIDLLFKELES